MRKISLLLFLCILFLRTEADDLPKGKNLVRNGNFEEGNTGFSSDLSYDSSEVSPGLYSITDNASKLNSTFIHLEGHTNEKDLYFVADPAGNENEKIWCSQVEVDSDTEYEFSVWMAIAYQSHENASKIIFSMNGNKIGETVSLGNQNWVQYTWRWRSGEVSGSVHLCLINDVLTSAGNDLAIDDAEFYSITSKPVVDRPLVGDTLPVKAHFPFGETGITDYSKQRLENLLVILNKYPEMNIKIVAHTDMYGLSAYNRRLSENRAKVIAAYLVSKSIDPERLQIEFLGENKLIYTGESTKKNVKNRRVEFVISGYR